MYYLGCIAYYEFNIDYIVETYCVNKDKPEFKCNGKCHLAKQLSKTSNDTDDNRSKSLRSIFESFLPVFISKNESLKFNNLLSGFSKKEIFSHCKDYIYLHESYLYKPPIS